MINIYECSECSQTVFKKYIFKFKKSLVCKDCLESFVFENASSDDIVDFMSSNNLISLFDEEENDNYCSFIEDFYSKEFINYYYDKYGIKGE